MNQSKRYGYCPMCQQNIEHTRTFSSVLTAGLDLMTLKILSLFRIGPWYCFQCERKTYYLHSIRRNVPTFHKESSRSDFNLREEELPTETEAVAIGNFLKRESLVLKNSRSSRFTEKFRDASVLRILSGANTMAQIRNELSVQESDLIYWIANFVARKQATISQYDAAVSQIKDRFPGLVNQTIEMEVERQPDNSIVIEGRVSPK